MFGIVSSSFAAACVFISFGVEFICWLRATMSLADSIVQLATQHDASSEPLFLRIVGLATEGFAVSVCVCLCKGRCISCDPVLIGI
jgi:hypothetical protein